MSGFHRKAMEALNKYVDDTLKEISLSKNFHLDTSENGWSLLSKQLAILRKAVPTFDIVTLYGFYHSSVWNIPAALRYASAKGELDGRLEALLTSEQFRELSARIKTTFNELPIEYVFFLHLPAVHLDKGFSETLIPQVTLLRISDDDAKTYGMQKRAGLLDLSFPAIETNQTYLKFSINGFASSIESCPASMELRTIIRELFTALYVYGYTNNPFPTHNRPAFGFRSVELKGYRVGQEDQEPISITLPFEIEQFVSRVEIDKSLFDIPKLPLVMSANGGFKKNTLSEAVAYHLSSINKLFASSNGNAERIRTSLEWFGFSLMTENETFSFIQAMTALEALLGDDKRDASLLKKVGDRLAFLLGETKEDRETIIEQFEQIYDTRSKLVHGRARQLTTDQAGQKKMLENLVRMVLRKEIGNHR